MEALRRQEFREPGVAAGMLGKPVIDLHDAARLSGSRLDIQVQRCAAWRRKGSPAVEAHVRLCPPLLHHLRRCHACGGNPAQRLLRA
jgi:hypothetical protein